MSRIAVFLLYSVNLCFGQDSSHVSKHNSFQLHVGLNQLKEENLHPKVHSGVIYGLYYSNTRTNIHQSIFQLGVQFSRTKTKHESLAASMNLQIDASYSYLFKMINRNKFIFRFGPLIELHYSLSHYPNWDESHLYWSDYLGFGIHTQSKYQLTKKQVLSLDISSPVVSVISRPQLNRMHKIDDISFGGIISSMHSNLEGAFWNHSLVIKSRVEYRFTISKRVSQAICYSFNYSRMKANKGLPFQDIQHLIGLKLYF